MRQALVDSSFLFALFSVDDVEHYRVRQFIRTASPSMLIPEVALTEVAYLINRAGGSRPTVAFMRAMAESKIERLPLNSPDLLRAAAIKEKYMAAEFDFVDCCIMALAERLAITMICTLDRRDFSIVRPLHCDYYELMA
jgi:predicted nucleic acid-binding protein